MLRTTLITGPDLALNLAEVKDHLRVTHNEEDFMIQRCIKSAVAYAENYLSLRLMLQTWDYFMDDFPTGDILLPYPPLISVTTIKYYDSDNAQQTLTVTTDYLVDIVTKPARIEYVNSWPTNYDKNNAIEVRFVCGYSTAGNIPENIINALYLLVGHFYENRQAVMTSTGALNQQVLDIGANDLLNLEKQYNPVLR